MKSNELCSSIGASQKVLQLYSFVSFCIACNRRLLSEAREFWLYHILFLLLLWQTAFPKREQQGWWEVSTIAQSDEQGWRFGGTNSFCLHVRGGVRFSQGNQILCKCCWTFYLTLWSEQFASGLLCKIYPGNL